MCVFPNQTPLIILNLIRCVDNNTDAISGGMCSDNRDVPAAHSKRFESADFKTIYTVYLSLCIQTADPNPIQGSHCICTILILLIGYCTQHLYLAKKYIDQEMLRKLRRTIFYLFSNLHFIYFPSQLLGWLR